MTHIVVLGGTGRVGRAVTAALRTALPSATLSITGRRPTPHGVAGDTATMRVVNLRDRAALDSVVAGADLIVNTTAPYFDHGTTALQAALRHRCHYVDVCDDWQPAVAMLDLFPAARDAGITAVVGAGLAPGLTNVLAMLAAAALTQPVSSIITGWSISPDTAAANPAPTEHRDELPGDEPDDVLRHLIYCCTEPTRILHDARFVDATPMQSRQVALGPHRAVPARVVGSPEAVTLGTHWPTLQHSINVMIGDFADIDGLAALAGSVRSGAITLDDAARWLAEPSADSTDHVPRQRDSCEPLPAVFATAHADGAVQPETVTAALDTLPAQSMTFTGSVAATMAVTLIRDDPARPGVFAIEDLVDPDTFLATLRELSDAQHPTPIGSVFLWR
ncbi:hypothetical protein TUM20983_37370 [Mycobacterium antarcticum]|uniref:saccharopine dehydrogenase NADP-binding domain-containing protein n=1 Tax=Mycolicibacterium sp. TUM20983 TaxID=3023369 RepID=UPI0023933A8E|nr:saccharopine dehydrogenase NADP-binding domain-containing protein [Mycolicibacterium sp. TUM20983]GLP76627.1 hypothetical protein TUM20983_37370 [Mycolicibacterium sp. TUM20983]